MSVWVLTEEYNEYNQNGEYFLEVFEEKPNRKTLARVLVLHGFVNHSTDEYLDFVLDGGGRRDTEGCWVHLREVTPFKVEY